MAEKRREERWSQRLRANVWEVESDRQFVGYTENVSASGMFLATPHPLATGTRVRVEVLSHDQSFVAEGVVSHVRRVPRELQRVKNAGMGVTLLPFEMFLSDVRPSLLTRPGDGQLTSRTAAMRPAAEPARPASGEAMLTAGRGFMAPPPRVIAAPPPAPDEQERRPPTLTASSTSTKGPNRGDGAAPAATVYTHRFDHKEDFLHAFEHDIKLGIFLVKTQVPAPDRSRVTIEVFAPAAKRPLRFAAEVVRGRTSTAGRAEPQAGMLVRFLEPTAVINALGVFARELRR